MNEEALQAKFALDSLIQKSRIHLYKPIQIAEILYYDRLNPQQINLSELEDYRNLSKRWRDRVTLRLLGTVSTSSARYQDDVFNNHAMPPTKLQRLGEINRQQNGIVENYIYHQFRKRQADVITAHGYLNSASITTFSLSEFLTLFEKRAGLKRSVDKVFEIVTYAFLSTLVDTLDVWVSIDIRNSQPQLIQDFDTFIEPLFGNIPDKAQMNFKAQLFRNGIANAADRGLDMWANFGPAIQVKHVSLSEKLVTDISQSIQADQIIVVCQSAEASLIESILHQIGIRIRGIITQDDLINAYTLCLDKHAISMGRDLVRVSSSRI